jgi:hydroxyacylglutathione hydrolase
MKTRRSNLPILKTSWCTTATVTLDMFVYALATSAKTCAIDECQPYDQAGAARRIYGVCSHAGQHIHQIISEWQHRSCRGVANSVEYRSLVMTVEVVRVAVLSDNYVWLVHEPVSGETVAVDPAVAEPVLAAAANRNWRITQIWNTHWHGDHTDGNVEIKAATGCTVTAPAAEIDKIPTPDVAVSDGDIIRIGNVVGVTIGVPAHTAGHVAYYLAGEAVLFSGDTLFAMGCGRLFEGSAAQMYDNMTRLAALGPETRVYCAHEYTLRNGRFALTAEPDNAELIKRMREVEAARAAGAATIPTTIALERATNPFMRAGSVSELARRRHGRDSFEG